MSNEPTIYPDETVLDDDYPVHSGYIYVLDGTPTTSDIFGTVRDLKRDKGVTEVRRCSLVKRGFIR